MGARILPCVIFIVVMTSRSYGQITSEFRMRSVFSVKFRVSDFNWQNVYNTGTGLSIRLTRV